MEWGRLGLAVLVAAVGTSLADWLFFGVLFHEKYKAFPEVWRRPQGGAGEGKAIGLSAAIGLMTPVVFVVLCSVLRLQRLDEAAGLAVACWLAACVPLLVGNYLFVKLHPLILVSHTLGWLVKFLIAAVAVALFRP
jgi:hypothetical protein